MTAAGLVAAAVVWCAATAPPATRRLAPRRRDRRAPLAALATAAIAAVAVGGLPAACAVGAVIVARRWRRIVERRTVAAASRRSFPDAVELVILAIRAGHTPAEAMRAVADSTPDELRPSFLAVVDRMAAGQRLADALGALNDGLGTIAEPLVDSLAAAERYGLPLAPVLDRLADEARSARRRQAEAAARQLPVRLAAPLVLCTLPSFVLLAIVPLLLGTFNSLHT